MEILDEFIQKKGWLTRKAIVGFCLLFVGAMATFYPWASFVAEMWEMGDIHIGIPLGYYFAAFLILVLAAGVAALYLLNSLNGKTFLILLVEIVVIAVAIFLWILII